MKQTTATANIGGLASTIVLVLAVVAVLVIALTNRKMLWINSDRAALITIVVLGMAMCARGIGRVAETGSWSHPLAIAAHLVGAAVLGLTIWVGLGKSLPLIDDARSALLAVVALTGIKFIISTVHSFIG